MDDAKVECLRLTSRAYEIAANAQLPPSQYFRYLEHLRWTTIMTSEKIPLRNFFGIGVVRAQHLELFEDVSFNVELELTAWLSRVGRTSFEFSHDVVRVDTGARVARSSATIVALDGHRRPKELEPGVHALVVDRGALEVERLGDAVPEGAWHRPLEVRPSDHDLQQHVNQARYADYIEDVRALCASAGGYGEGPYGGAVHRLSVYYEHETRAGDALIARTFRAAGRDGTVDFLFSVGATTIAKARVTVR
jgi:acyl-CoA thioesterase FadM